MEQETQYQAGLRHAAQMARDKARKQRPGSVLGSNPRARVLEEFAAELEKEAQR